MLAEKIKEKYIKKEMRDKVGVIAITQGEDKTWYHIHDDEDVPEPEESLDIAIHIRKKL